VKFAGRRSLLLLLLLLVSLAALLTYPRFQKKSDNSVIQPTPAESRLITLAQIEDIYRLRPDRRFLLAIPEIHFRLSGKKSGEVTTSFSNNRWHIFYDNKEIGSTSPFPDFDEMMTVLQSWASNVKQQSNVQLTDNEVTQASGIEEKLEQLQPIQALKTIDDLAKKWPRDTHLMSFAARAYVLLSWETLYMLRLTDAIPARALALLAISRMQGKLMSEDEALLARRMGYSRYSSEVAKNVPISSAAQMFLLGNEDQLKQAAEAEDASARTRYFYLLLFSAHSTEAQFLQWAQKNFSEKLLRPALLSMVVELGKFDTEVGSSQEVQHWVINELPGDLNHFESNLAKLSSEADGTFLDSDFYSTYYRSFLYSSLVSEGLFYYDKYGSIETVQQFAATLKNLQTGLAPAFVSWYSHIAESFSGKPNFTEMLNDLKNPELLGRPIVRTHAEIMKKLDYRNRRGLEATHLLAASLDTRPRDRSNFGKTSFQWLRDIKQAGDLYDSLIHVTTPDLYGFDFGFYASFENDHKMQKELLESPNFAAIYKAEMIKQMSADQSIQPEEIKQAFEKTIQMDPDELQTYQNYARYLKQLKQYDAAAAVIQKWLNSHDASYGFNYIFAWNSLAESYLLSRKYEDGLNAINHVVGSWQGGSMELASDLLDRLGRDDEAIKMAENALARYPDSASAQAAVARLGWRHGKYKEAADVFARSQYPPLLADWCWYVATEFAKEFASRDADQGVEAFKELKLKKENPSRYSCFGDRAADAGNPQLAHLLLAHLITNGLATDADVVNAYKFRTLWKGEDDALEWLQSVLPEQKRANFAYSLFWSAQYKLLWDYMKTPENTDNPGLVWLFRAAADAKLGSQNNPHHKELDAFFQQPAPILEKAFTRDKILLHAGKFLLGLETKEQFLKLAVDSNNLCKIAYFVALKAESEGDYVTASKWYRLAIETGQNTTTVYNWAWETLAVWQQSGKDLDFVAAHHLGISDGFHQKTEILY
jgi:hypothetical protein